MGAVQLRLRGPRARTTRTRCAGRPRPKSAAGAPTAVAPGGTSRRQNHRHQVTHRRRRQRPATDMVQGHWHEVDRRDRRRARRTYVVGPPEDMLTARVPVYGKLRFKDRERQADDNRASTSATNGSIAASSKAARWPRPSGRSRTSRPERFPDGLPRGNDHPRVPLVQGRHRKGHLGQPVLRESATGDREPVSRREFDDCLPRPRTFVTSIDADAIPAQARRPDPARPARSTCSTTWSPTASWKSGCSASTERSTSASPRPTCTCAPATPRSR